LLCGNSFHLRSYAILYLKKAFGMSHAIVRAGALVATLGFLAAGDALSGEPAATTLAYTADAAPVADFAQLDKKWNGQRAMRDIATQLSYTPRSLDTPGHKRTIALISSEMKKSGGVVRVQEWNYVDASGVEHRLTNIIARFAVDNPRRIIVGTHYDSIVRAYRDAKNPNAPMPGANNSASGVAILLETARVLKSSAPPPFGVDFIFFDGEEGPLSLGAGDPNWFALGSPYFSKHLRELYPDGAPLASVIFDMVCYRELKLRPEPGSIQSAPLEVEKFWKIGASVAPSVFIREPTRLPISDDHTALASSGIPSILVIDFDYEPWFNTTGDTLDKCSTESLDAVGRTLVRYLYAR
jgi:glutaminyl-peptide cyclotransferase